MAASDAFYKQVIADIAPVFTELGTTYTVSTPGAYDELTLTTAPATTRNVVGLVADQQTAVEFAGLAGATWVATKTLILTADANPRQGEEITVDGRTYPLDKIVPIKPADIVVIYMLDVSK